MSSVLQPFLLYDFETTGFPLWGGVPSDDIRQPHIVSAAAQLCTYAGDVLAELDYIVKPDGWVSCAEALAVHGITHDQAMAEGIPEKEVLDQMLALAAMAEERVAFNEAFDARIAQIALKRYKGEEAAETWKTSPRGRCAMNMARRTKQYGTYTLAFVYEQITGEKHAEGHRAMGDVRALHKVFFHLLRAEDDRAALSGLPIPGRAPPPIRADADADLGF